MRKIAYILSLFLIIFVFISSVNAVDMENDLFDDNCLGADETIQNHEKSVLTDKSSENSSSKILTDIQISYKDNLMVGDTNRITVYNLPNDTNGKVFLYDSNADKNYSIDLVNGQGYKDIKMYLGSGTGDLGPSLYNYYIVVSFEGDDVYEPSSTDAFFRVNKYYPNMQIHYKNIKSGEDAIVRFTLEKDASGRILLTVNGKDYEANVLNGEAIFIVKGLSSGKYNLTAAYFGDEKYDWDYASGVLTVSEDGLKKNFSSNHVNKNKNMISLNDYPTGNPIFSLVYVLSIIGIGFRKK